MYVVQILLLPRKSLKSTSKCILQVSRKIFERLFKKDNKKNSLNQRKNIS
jgi:hypothetical protein